MNFKSIPIIVILTTQILIGQSEGIDQEATSADKSVQGAFGAVTIDGKIWNQIALRPVLPFGKLSVALDLVIYIDQDGNIHDDEWDFSSGEKVKNTIIDKIYYVRYGNRWDKNYFKIGALDNVTMGYGILLNNYSNTLLYPQVRKVGMEFRTQAFGVNVYGFTNDFKENLGVTGVRLSAPISYGFTGGVSWVGDRNQYLGLKDSDDDGRPDLVDDFPDNGKWWVDTDGDGWADMDTLNEFDVDGDGWTDSAYTWPLWGIVIDPDGVSTKPEPINIKENLDPINSFALDIGIPLLREGPISLDAYAQYAALLGKTIDPIKYKETDGDGWTDNDTLNEIDAGYGIIPFGLSAGFGPAKLNFEFRMIPKGNFEFGYFNRSYEIERATFQSITGNRGKIITKASKLGTYGKQNGFYSSLNIDLGSLFDAGLAFQNLNGEQYNSDINDFEKASNQNFTAILKLAKPISKIDRASWFYQQRNVPNPFDFEHSESTITGYNASLKLGNGMVLTYIFRRTFQDFNGDGDVKDEGETINMTSIETSFSF
ncbi:MAG: hypothetical protein VYD66_05555 [Candidatus Neomarinimicrobiota bacterium]|nr:hypothetical protein [Candidatus Neomarinimicrobiota bacterium]